MVHRKSTPLPHPLPTRANTHTSQFCFIPIIPFSLKPDHDVGCHICNFYQDVKFRPDVQSQIDGGQGAGGGIPMQPQNQGWGQGPPPQQYQQGQQPMYK